jgi:hypothetical protein
VARLGAGSARHSTPLIVARSQVRLPHGRRAAFPRERLRTTNRQENAEVIRCSGRGADQGARSLQMRSAFDGCRFSSTAQFKSQTDEIRGSFKPEFTFNGAARIRNRFVGHAQGLGNGGQALSLSQQAQNIDFAGRELL